MTLEEFERRLRAQAQYQGSQAQKDDIEQNKRIINQRGDTSPVVRNLSNFTTRKEEQQNENSFNKQLITKNKDVRSTLRAPISSTIKKTTGISADNAVKEDKSNNIFSDLGNVAKNSWIGVKLGGLNFINGLSKIGNIVSDKVFNREEKTIKAIDEDLKNLGIDGSGLTLEEKIKKLIDVDPLSMDKYNRLLTVNSMTSTGDDLGSKIINAMAVLRGNNNNFLLAPYQDLMNGVTLTEDENGNYVPDSWISDRQINETDKRIIELEEEANKNTEDINNPALKYASNLMPSLGSNATSLVINTVAPGIGSLFFTGSAVNSYALDGKERGLSDDAALLYGSILGVADGQLEKIGLNNLTKAGKEMVKGSTKKALKSYATSMVDNYIQEALMEPVQETTNQIFTGESDWSNMPSRMNQAGVAGAVSSAILGGASAGISKGVNIATNINQQNKLKTQITEKINNNTMLEKDVKTQMLNSLDKLNVNSLTNLNHELDTIDEVITQINKSDITNVIESRKNSLNSNQNSKVSLFSQYKNSKLDNNVINSAMEIVPSNKQNKRTKDQWLKVAEQIGNNINSEDAEMYAYKTWMDMRPNNKNNLNRQGKSYVPFTVDEWVNKVKEASSNNVTNNQEQIKSVNELSPKNIENALFDDEFYKRFEYEDRSKINDTIENLESKREELLKNTKNNEFNDEIFDINAKINALKNGYDNLYDYYVGRAKNDVIEEYNRNPAKYEKIINQKQQQLDNEQKLNVEIQESTPQKRQQYEIIKQTNPMLDDYHTGIRSPEDIKTFNEVINDEDSFAWGDFSKEDAQQALKQGKITVYSSYPIEQGVFVSTSKMQAQEYAGGNGSKVYSKEVPLEDVAWINGDEGQYAKLVNDNKTSEEIQFKNEIDIKQRKVYNKITTKNISNAEKAQVSSEVNQFRKDDGTHFIDLSKNGYKSYIYHKDGNNVDVLARVSGNEDFINYVRRGIENGTYNYTKGPSEWATEFKTKYRNYSISNDSLSRERTSSRNDNVVNRTNRQENNTNRRNDIKQNSGNESRELAPTSSLLEKLENKKSNIIDEKVSEYIKSVKDNFNTDINIDTNVVNKDNIVPIDYGNEKQTTIYKRARDIFQKIGKRVFINKNDGEKIYVTNTDINESISKTIKNPKQNKLLKENMAVFSKLDKIIENGKEISNSKIDSKGRENFSDYRYYVTNAIINGKKYVVEFDTRVQERNNGAEERHFRLERIYEIKEGDSATGADIKSTSQVVTESPSINNIIPSEQNYVNDTKNNQKTAPVKKIMNPAEIANMKESDVSSTPKLPTRDYGDGNKKSSFFRNVTSNSKFLNQELRNELKTEKDVKFYQGVTNEQSLTNALNKLNDGGEIETLNWFNKKDKFTADDVAEGWILMKRYQDSGNYEGAVEVAKKMRDIGTSAGQAVQAFNIYQRLTPEGMVNYAQGELSEAFEKMSKNKTQKWIDSNREKFQLTPDETAFIIENVKEAQKLEDNSYEKKVKLAEIQKVMTDKLPPERGAGMKSWMRISMLFNPKTQVRNVAGNAIIAPVNAVSDTFSAIADKMISSKTGVRTTGFTNIKNYAKGIGKGLYESYNDFKKGINTRNVSGNRFEIGQGKSFNDNNILGKALNKTDSLLSFMLDAGDRMFYEASFTNSINNQMVLNNSTEVTQDMIDIATKEALQRTWQDNNNYTKFVLDIRRGLNKANIGGYGLGDVLIPFAKTPANLTKAIIDYSPLGVVSTIKSGINLKNSLSNGQYTPQMQHQFVQNLGKATAGTMLYILGYALASAGIITGESDEDKDVANFMKNTLGTSSYSIKIGDKSFQYDWAQPVSAPFSIMADLYSKSKNNEEQSLKDTILSVLDTPANLVLEQSFMQSIQTVLNNNDGVVSGLFEAVEELPSRAIPTFMKQIADMIDPVQRTTYDKTSPTNTAINKVKAKIPFVSKTLAPTVDTLGREVKKYGGNNGIFNVFINPANVNSSSVSRSAREIYNLYKATGDKTIMPRVAGYSLTYNNENYNLTPEERARYQKTMGKYVNSTVEKLLNNSNYEKLTDIEKTEIVNQIVSDGNEYAKEEYAKNNNIEYERKNMNVKVDNKIKEGLDTTNAYIFKTKINDIEGEKGVTNSELNNKLKYIMNMNTDDKQKQFMVELSSNDTDYNVSVSDLNKLKGNYLTYLQQSGKTPENGGMTAREKYIKLVDANIPVEQLNKYYNEIGDVEGTKDENGKTISGSKKQAVFNYINSLSLNIPQKQILLAKEYDSFAKEYYWDIVNYINLLNITKEEKSSIFSSIYN